jgi:copper chaperone NosL
MKLILFFILLILASCNKDNELKPVDIHYGQDICERCKMIISEEKFSSQLILNNGKVYNFDDIGGMIIYISENKINPENEKIYVKDFITNKWLNSDEAVYIKLENINTPMNFGIIAVSNRDAANKIISEHGGKITGSFADTLNILKD